jgi:hypothetical protein
VSDIPASERDGGSARSEPAALRNREPILGVLRPLLDDPATPAGAVVETAAGHGIHACFLAPHFPARPWLATERDAGNVAVIADRIAARPDATTLGTPLAVDVGAPDWAADVAAHLAGGGPVAAILNVNMIHIAPWEAGLGLLAGAGRLLAPGGVLYLYGPYRIGGAHTGPGNVAFDDSLRARDPSWGIRDLDDVTVAAAAHGLQRAAVIAMPADNLSVVFRRTS